MKCKAGISLFLLLLFLIITSVVTVNAETNLNELDPNIYEEKERKENTNYLHEKSLYEKRNAIPEEQKNLTFKKPLRDEQDELKKQLFTAYTKEKNTIKSKSEQMELFSGNPEPTMSMAETEVNASGQNSGLTMTYILLIAIGVILMMGLLIPRMSQGKK
jgi:type VII secretion protein EssA